MMAGGPTVGTIAHPLRGTVLTDGAGRSVYLFSRDPQNDNQSTCYADDGCSDYWPPVLVEGAIDAPPELASRLGTQERRDGGRQLTYNGHPLYYYVVDRQPGQFAGDALTDEWGGWFLVGLQ